MTVDVELRVVYGHRLRCVECGQLVNPDLASWTAADLEYACDCIASRAHVETRFQAQVITLQGGPADGDQTVLQVGPLAWRKTTAP